MNQRKLLSLLLAVVLCVSMALFAFAEPEAEGAVPGQMTQEEESSVPAQNDPEEESSVTPQNGQEEESSVPLQNTQEEESSRPVDANDPEKADVIAAIIRLLNSNDLKEVKAAFNDVNEALGLPRVDDFTDMAAYADALYEKLQTLGLGYDDIINAVSSSDLIDWVNKILFPSEEKMSNKPTAKPTAAGGRINRDNSVTSPKTGVSYSAAGAAAVTLLLSLGVVVLLKRRGIYAE